MGRELNTLKECKHQKGILKALGRLEEGMEFID